MAKLSFQDLENKVCVITGGGGVIGTSIAKGLAASGVKTVILDLNYENAELIANEITDKYNIPSIGVKANVLDKKSLQEAYEYITKEFGRIDMLINGAGGNSPKATTKIEELTNENIQEIENSFYGLEMEGFQKVFDLNFMGTLLPTMVFTKEMATKGKGVVLNISSMNSYRPLTKIPAYSAAKASINNFTQWLSVHLAKMGIRVNAIAPGFFLTNQNRFLLVDEKTNELTDRGRKIINSTPMDKFGEPEDLQGTVLYLLSDVSAFVTGVIIPVDGGFNAYSGV
jgi:NAD(P)-dependent dehydrogenase (short-subunit alcohol dehydrogenase family)